MKDKCCYCGREEDHSLDDRGFFKIELRPYGPNGAWACFACATSPAHEEETKKNFDAQMDAAGPVVLIGEKTGPRPLLRKKSS